MTRTDGLLVVAALFGVAAFATNSLPLTIVGAIPAVLWWAYGAAEIRRRERATRDETWARHHPSGGRR